MRVSVLLAVLYLGTALGTVPALADELEQAREHAQKGLAAYALGQYARAAEEYEQSFALKADPALLYDAAQAQRLAGNKPRALLLYENYLRLFQDQPNRAEVMRHIAELKQAIESEKKAVTAPPTGPLGAASGETASPAARTTAPAPAAASAPAVAAPAAPSSRADLTATAPERKRIKPWVWGVIGGAAAVVVAVGLGVGLGLGLSAPAANPTPTLGTAMVH